MLKKITVFFLLTSFSLNAQTYATLPFNDNFSSSLSSYWTTSATDAAGVVNTLNLSGAYPKFGTTTDASGTVTSSYGLVAYNTSNLSSSNTINADLKLNLLNKTGISLKFSVVDWGSGYSNDLLRIYVSNDGGSSFGTTSTTLNLYLGAYADGSWNNANIDLSSLFTANSLTPSSTSVIRFAFVLKGSGNTSSPKLGNQMIYLDNLYINNTSSLPVELLSFIGENVGESNLLTWQTVSEVNNDYFILEKSMNGIDFFKIAEIDGNGSINVMSSYSYSDNEISSSVNYYRLVQVDFDGASYIHETIVLYKDNELVNISLVSPTKLLLQGEGLRQLLIYNTEGKMLYNYQLNANLKQQELILPSLYSATVYHVIVLTKQNNYSKNIMLQ